VQVDGDPEVLGLRAVLRDLLAVSAISAAWTGREPTVVATGLAEALVELLRLDFAFVRLRDPSGGPAVDITRGGAGKTLSEWLERDRAAGVRFSRKEIVSEAGGVLEPCRGFANPIGVNGEGGLVAVACARSDFPTEMEQLLVSHAANQAATAFQSARLIEERLLDVSESRRRVEESSAELAASRARLVTAADEERRRVVRDLHDGAQQRLVHTIATLKCTRRELEQSRGDGLRLVDEAQQQAQAALEELRELAHGILPSVLTVGGLRAGVVALASRMSIPIQVDVAVQRLPAAVEATAYFIVAEALTNVAKHARAHRATVTAHVGSGILEVEVVDDGVGGAQATGSGLVGLKDRLAVHDGRLRITSPTGGGTLLAASIPIA
jgi:signal transduction histidine kinase